MMSKLFGSKSKKKSPIALRKEGFEFLKKVHGGNTAILDDMIAKTGTTKPSDVAELKSHIKNLADFIFSNQITTDYVKKCALTGAIISTDEKTKFIGNLAHWLLRQNDIDVTNLAEIRKLNSAAHYSFSLFYPEHLPDEFIGILAISDTVLNYYL